VLRRLVDQLEVPRRPSWRRSPNSRHGGRCDRPPASRRPVTPSCHTFGRSTRGSCAPSTAMTTRVPPFSVQSRPPPPGPRC
jgi:hypothetical protein